MDGLRDVVDMTEYIWREEGVKMTTLQLERELYNINEHGPFCECLLCHQREMQSAEKSTSGMSEIEQELIAVLQDLPLAISITKQEGREGEEYRWHCLEASGKETSFVEATRGALQSLVGVLQPQ